MKNLARVGWPSELCSARTSSDAERTGRTHVSDDWEALVRHPGIDIIIESTGNPAAAVEHALAAFRSRKHVVMVTVEADALCGPLLARRAKEAGVIYSLAYGDQPALICDLVDWARAAGFSVVAAGRGHKWQPHFAQSTPETVWTLYGLTPEQAELGGLNPKMFNSFLDGSKPAIEMTAVCNATGLTPAPEGLLYPPGSVDEIPALMRPRQRTGVVRQHQVGGVEEAASSPGNPSARAARGWILRNRGEPSGFGKLAGPIMAAAMRRANRKDLMRLKTILEGRSEDG